MKEAFFSVLAREDLGITEVFATENDWPQGHRFHIQNRARNQIYINLSGKRSYDLPDGTHFEADANEVLFMPENSSYITTAESAEGNRGIGVLFYLLDSEGHHRIIGDRPTVLRPTDDGGRYQQAMREILHCFLQGGFALLRGKEALYALLRTMAEDCAEETASEERRSVLPAKKYIETHLQETVTAEKLATVCFLSRSTFFRRFSREFGETPAQMHLRLRIEKGRQMLASGAYSVEQVAEKLGFCDTAHFCHTFLQRTGIKPGDLRAKSPKPPEK